MKKGTILQCIHVNGLATPETLTVGHLYVIQRNADLNISSTVTIKVGDVNLSFYI
jgi:hypothetical protein